MKKQILNQAIDDLSFAIMHLSQNINFEIHKETTNNFEAMKNDYEKTKILKVSSYGSENSIYKNKYINILARVFHDKIHLQHNLNFSKEDEISVARIQFAIVKNFLLKHTTYENATNAAMLLFIDIKDQVDYYYKYNKFVKNQYKFVEKKFYKYLKKENKC